MKLLLFAGTAEGRLITEQLARMRGVDTTVCVATEYGRKVLGVTAGNIEVISERLSGRQMEALVRKCRFELVVDATHPYAAEVTANIKNAVAAEKIPYLRVVRPEGAKQEHCYHASVRDAAKALCDTAGNVLAATGGKELEAYTVVPGYEKRLYPRVLPAAAAIAKCEALGFTSSHIIAMQGPFSAALNAALMEQFNIRWLVTKDGGAAGGFMEKLEAAERCGVKVLVIGRPTREEGYSAGEVIDEIKRRLEGTA